MKLLLDFFPIILFFVAFKVWGIYVATGVAIVATVAQIGWLRYKTGKTEPMQWVSLGVIVLFGGTVLYWLMAGTLAAGQLIFRKNLLKSLMGAQMQLPESAWRVTNWSWITFFSLMGVLNLWVAFNFDTDTWVNFKLFGGVGLMAVFVIGQALYLGRYTKSEEAPKP
jgi:intracellular septation protein